MGWGYRLEGQVSTIHRNKREGSFLLATRLVSRVNVKKPRDPNVAGSLADLAESPRERVSDIFVCLLSLSLYFAERGTGELYTAIFSPGLMW